MASDNSITKALVTEVNRNSTHLLFDLSDIEDFNRRADQAPWLGAHRRSLFKEAKRLMDTPTDPTIERSILFGNLNPTWYGGMMRLWRMTKRSI